MKDKKILLCVTGGIAVYKAVALTSKLVQAGAELKVLMSDSAAKFVTPLTFQALSRNEVYIDTFDEKNPHRIAHIDLADWADLVIVAPATANTIGKMANGIADNMITTTLLATLAPIWIAPAMNVHMYGHPAVKKNLAILDERGCGFIEPSEGFLACGYIGKGRLEEPEKITQLVKEFFEKDSRCLRGKKVVVTAGPTREKIDPVRFISNHSTGKMGYAIAKAAKKAGAEVVIISGPVSLPAPAGVDVVKVESADDMYQACMDVFAGADVVIKTAAVADYRPKRTYDHKIKKQPGDATIELERTKDILKELGLRKTNQILIGFAAETDHVEEYAAKKLREKNADMIVANNVKEAGAGFGTETNKVSFFKKDGSVRNLPIMTKQAVAEQIVEEISQLLKDRKQKYFSKYQKAKNAITVVVEQIEKARTEVDYFDSLLQQVQSASPKDIAEIREELVEGGYIRERQRRNGRKAHHAKPVLDHYTASDGTEIIVGKNNKQNDYLTNKLAARDEIWLHTKDIPGSHVVIRSKEPSEETVREAAILAAYFSKARQSSSVPVDFTKVRYVKKPNGAKPGFVIYENQQTVYVTPDEEVVLKLKK